MELLPLDYVLAAIAGFFLIVGLFKGLSGWLGTITGTAAASVAGMMGMELCRMAVAECSWIAPSLATPAAMVLDFLGALIVFGIVRRIVAKFVNFLVPQPLNALLGMLGGLFISIVIAALLASTAMLEGCALEDGLAARNSNLVKIVAGVLKSTLEGGES